MSKHKEPVSRKERLVLSGLLWMAGVWAGYGICLLEMRK